LLDSAQGAAAVVALCALPQVAELRVEPLPRAALDRLLRGELSLDPALAAAAVERSGGNPQLALTLVEEALAAGERVGSPSAPLVQAAEAWRSRVRRVQSTLTRAQRRALVAAAVGGPRVHGPDWTRVCEQLGVPADLGLVADLRDRGLVALEPGPGRGWRFVHPLAGEAVWRGEEPAFLRRVHAAWAAVLGRRLGDAVPDQVAGHLLGAGEAEEGARCLRVAARRHLSDGAYPIAALRLEEHLRVEAEARLTDADRLDADLLRVRLSRLQARLDDAEAGARRCQQAAEAARLPIAAGRALLELAWVKLYRGELEDCLHLAARTRASELAGADDRVQAESAGLEGNALFMLGRLDQAAARYRQAADAYRALGDLAAYGAALLGLGNAELAAGRLEAAGVLLEDARRIEARCGRAAAVGDCLNSQGEVARLSGDLDLAAHLYALARDLLRGAGSARALYPEANLAAVELARGRTAAALTIVGEVAPRARRSGHQGLELELLVVEARCRLALGEEGAGEALARFRAGVQETGFHDVNLAEALSALGREAGAAGDVALATIAWAAAAAQWRELDRGADAARARAALEALEA
jgi:tetratricopeptide (TPR) repeat protein